MSLVKWTPSLAVGVEAIDTQHQELFRRIEVVIEALQTGRDAGEVRGLLTFLEEYVQYHFQAEEAEMVRTLYPGFAQHRGEHQEFIRDLNLLLAEYARNGQSAHFAVRVNNRVGIWLVNHVMRSDRALGLHLKQWAARERSGTG